MKQRNCIKSIKVKLKPVNLAVGETYYTGRHGCMKKVLVKGDPYNKYPHEPRGMWVCDAEQAYLPTGSPLDEIFNRGTMRDSMIYLGDDGIEGFKYDDRPSGLSKTQDGADFRYKHYSSWLTAQKAKHNYYGWPHYDFF